MIATFIKNERLKDRSNPSIVKLEAKENDGPDTASKKGTNKKSKKKSTNAENIDPQESMPKNKLLVDKKVIAMDFVGREDLLDVEEEPFDEEVYDQEMQQNVLREMQENAGPYMMNNCNPIDYDHGLADVQLGKRMSQQYTVNEFPEDLDQGQELAGEKPTKKVFHDFGIGTNYANTEIFKH